MKTHLGAGIGSKNPRRRVQNAPEHGRTFGVQEPIWHFWSVERHFNGLFWALAQQTSGDKKAHPFRSFRKGMSPNLRSTLWGYFLEFSNPYK